MPSGSSDEGLRPRAADGDYRAFVGPAERYDLMGATQFRLLCTLGLRAGHTLLDFGCGSLRAGRLFIVYLNAGGYFGIEPNRWLIDAAIAHQVGNDLVRLKKPRFAFNSDFETSVFSTQFDFIVAQSIFSHASSDLIKRALARFKQSLKPGGLVAATFLEGSTDFEGKGWVYPGCVSYRPSTIRRFGEEVDLSMTRIPWHHPRQSWYLLASEEGRLPARAMMRHLSGAVLSGPSLADGGSDRGMSPPPALGHLKRLLPRPIRNSLGRLLARRQPGSRFSGG